VGSAKPDIAFLPELQEYGPPEFFRSREELDQASANLPYLHAMRQAWKRLDLDGIFCVQGRPAVYFKEVRRKDLQQAAKLQRLLWNQGTATLLVLIHPTEIQVYSGLVRPARFKDDVNGDHRLVDTLERTAQGLELRSLIRQVETGRFYEVNPDSFKTDQAADHFLLENLRALRDKLHTGVWDYRSVHTLLGRIIFVCYLVDRGIVSEGYFQRATGHEIGDLNGLFSLPPKKLRASLGALFTDLKKRFNGSMFVEGDHTNIEKLSDEQIHYISKFLQGEELVNSQLTLGFWGYDFSVIPIETISAIYEEFLAKEDPDEQKNSGAFYTKRHLAEFVVNTATEGVEKLHSKKCLDPACGSGIFLVILFSRMAESWRREYPRSQNGTRTKALIEILRNQLCGVDRMETACRITCFSLYLTLLDQLEPPDIEALQEKGTVLPDILALKSSNYDTSDARVVVEGNFFDRTLPIDNDFDLVLGNPPWVSRGHSENEAIPTNWYSSELNPYLRDAPRGKAARRACFMPNGELAIPFLWKAPLHLKDSGQVCMLVPSKVLLNKATNEFQASWFSHHEVRKVVQLADLRFILFENAICPTTVLLYSRPTGHEIPPIEYLAPKATRDDPRPDAIAISPDDVKYVGSRNVLHLAEAELAPLLWKKLLWSTPRDMKLLDYLSTYPPLSDLAGRPSEDKRWVQGQGFQPSPQVSRVTAPKGYGEPKSVWWGPEYRYIDANSVDIHLVLTPRNCPPVGARFGSGLHRDRDPRIFSGPMVLFSQGFTKRAYCDFPVLFRHSLQSISGSDGDRTLLKFLAAYFNSQLATYFLFHTAANWGTERDKAHLFEVMRLPFPLPEQFSEPERQYEILSSVEQLMDDYAHALEDSILHDEHKLASTLETLNTLVNSYFELSEEEIMLVKDTVEVIEPSSTPSSKAKRIETLRNPDHAERKQYADTLCSTLNEWAKRGPWRVSAALTIAQNQGMALVTLKKSDKSMPASEQKAADELDGAIRCIRGVLREKRGGLNHLLDFKVFDGSEIHMLKRLELRYWTRTAALNDADEIAAAILKPRG